MVFIRPMLSAVLFTYIATLSAANAWADSPQASSPLHLPPAPDCDSKAAQLGEETPRSPSAPRTERMHQDLIDGILLAGVSEARLRLPSHSVRAFGAVLQKPGHGAPSTLSVIDVTLKSGKPGVLKIYATGPRVGTLDILPSVLMQEAFGKLGYAPKVLGILDRAEMEALRARGQAVGLSLAPPPHGGMHGVLMEKIPDAVAFPAKTDADHSKLRARVARLNRKDTLRRLKRMSALLKELRISPRDAQLLFPAEGPPVLADFDAFGIQVTETRFEPGLNPPNRAALARLRSLEAASAASEAALRGDGDLDALIEELSEAAIE